MPWSFVEINHVSYSYSSLLDDILSGVYQLMVTGTFVDTLTKLLWHLDSQYQKLEQEVPSSQKVPAIFKRKFSGYNLPENSKHHKREIQNLSCQKMEELIQCWYHFLMMHL